MTGGNTAMLRMALVAALAVTAFTACSFIGDACCDCTADSTETICLYNPQYCDSSLYCEKVTKMCAATPPPVISQSADCGVVGQICCDVVNVIGQPVRLPCLGTAVCASGSCVDPEATPIIQQSNACIGAWKDCDEGLTCLTTNGVSVCVDLAPKPVIDSSG